MEIVAFFNIYTSIAWLSWIPFNSNYSINSKKTHTDLLGDCFVHASDALSYDVARNIAGSIS
jgi:hypothetical protein